jgi:hypothetical protein
MDTASKQDDMIRWLPTPAPSFRLSPGRCSLRSRAALPGPRKRTSVPPSRCALTQPHHPLWECRPGRSDFPSLKAMPHPSHRSPRRPPLPSIRFRRSWRQQQPIPGAVSGAPARYSGSAAVPPPAHRTTVLGPDRVPQRPKGRSLFPRFLRLTPTDLERCANPCSRFMPAAAGPICDQERFQKGNGCQNESTDEPGVLLDRTSPRSPAVSAQHTTCERLKSHATALGASMCALAVTGPSMRDCFSSEETFETGMTCTPRTGAAGHSDQDKLLRRL